MSEWERDRRKADRIRACLQAPTSASALACRLDSLKHEMRDDDRVDLWDVLKLAKDVNSKVGRRIPEAGEILRTLEAAEESKNPDKARSAVTIARSKLDNVLQKLSDQCGRALRVPPPKRKAEPTAPPAQVIGRRRR